MYCKLNFCICFSISTHNQSEKLAPKRRAPVSTQDDDEESEEEETPVKRTRNSRSARPEPEPEESEPEEPTPRRGRGAKPTAKAELNGVAKKRKAKEVRFLTVCFFTPLQEGDK